MKYLSLFILACFTLVATGGCEKSQPLPQGVTVFSQPQELKIVELPHRALPLWRVPSEEKPSLVLLSADALLQPIPAQLQEQVRKLALNGSRAELIAHGPLRAETVILPGQTLRAALSAGLFSQVLWVLPQSSAEEAIDLDATRDALFTSGAIDDYEAQSLEKTSNGFRGTLAGTPFEALLASSLPSIKLETPAVLHIDLTFFTSLYRDEIKTPIYPLITQNLLNLKSSGIRIISSTFSLDTLIGQTPLDLRFIGKTVKTTFSDPTLFDRPAPNIWELRAKARYFNTFFQPDKTLELTRKLLKLTPGNASSHYALYQELRLNKMHEEAIIALNEAVALEPAYSREYMLLAAQNYQQGNLEGTVLNYQRALKAYPQDVTIKINLAQALSDAKQRDDARALLNKLRQLNWTASYYSETIPFLDALLAEQQAQP